MSNSKLLYNREQAMDWNAAVRCIDCGEEDFIDDDRTGDTICTRCGCVVAESNIDMGKEWRSFSSVEEKAKARTGAPASILIPDKGLSTVIGKLMKGTPEQFNAAKRLRFSNARNRGSNIERNLKKAYNIMDVVAISLKIPKTAKEKSVLIYRAAVKNKLSRGRPMDALVCATMFIGCKRDGVPRPLEDFCRHASDKQIRNCLKLLVEKLRLNLSASEARDFVPQIAQKGVISQRTIVMAWKILSALEEAPMPPSRDPRGIAAAALYIACKKNHTCDGHQTQRDLAVYAKVTEVTVRNRIKEIHDRIEFE